MSIFMKSNEISDPINVGRDRAFAVTTCDHVTVNRLKKWGLEFRHDSDSVRSAGNYRVVVVYLVQIVVACKINAL
jgi:hypothetical protein